MIVRLQLRSKVYSWCIFALSGAYRGLFHAQRSSGYQVAMGRWLKSTSQLHTRVAIALGYFLAAEVSDAVRNRASAADPQRQAVGSRSERATLHRHKP